MTRVTTDPSKKLTIYSRIGMSNTKRFTFFNGDGTDYDLSGVTLSIGIKRPRFLEDVITLTSGSGLTISGNDVDLELTSLQSAEFDERVYYFELRRVISGKQKVWLNGDHIWHKGTFDAFNDNGTNITIDDNGEDVLITISESGSGGGAVDSVNGATGVVVLDADDINDTSTTHKFVTSTDITKLSNLSGTNTGDQDLSSYATLTGTQTLTNKRITQRVQSVASSATVTANADTNDMVIVTAQAEALTLANPSGTPTEGQGLIYRIKDNGTARTIGYGANFRAMGITLPTTTVINKTLYLACVWNVADSRWDVIGERQEA